MCRQKRGEREGAYLSEVARYESTCNGVLVAVVCLFSTRLNNMNIDIGII